MFRFMTKSADGIVGPRTSFQEEVRFLARKNQHRHLSEVGGGVRLNGIPPTGEGKGGVGGWVARPF